MRATEKQDFFISYTAVDDAWARWIAVELERANYTTLVQAFDIRPGSNFVHAMQQAATTSARTIAVLSPAYLESAFGESEWQAAFQADPTGERGLLIPARVQLCQPPGLLASRVYIDLLDVDEETARARLLDAVGKRGVRPTSVPFPGNRPIAPASVKIGATAPYSPARVTPSIAPERPRVQNLWTSDLMQGYRTMRALERSSSVDIGVVIDRAPYDTHVMRMVRHLLAQRPAATAGPLIELIRETPVTGDGWQAARYAAYALTPAHHDHVAKELRGFLRGDIERERMTMVALGSCAVDEAATEIAERALFEPQKLASWAADGLVQMLLACTADRLPTVGTRVVDALDVIMTEDSQALLHADEYLKSLPASHAYLLADRWLKSGDLARITYAANALGYSRATRARRELAERAVRTPDHAGPLLRAVGYIGGAPSVELLVARMDSPRVGVAAQEALCLCLHEAPGSELDKLIDRLLRTQLNNRWAIFQMIGLCGASQFIGPLSDGLSSDSALERGMAALGLAEFERSGLISQIWPVFEEATEASEILMAGLALLRLTSNEELFLKLDQAVTDAAAWALPPMIFDHVITVLQSSGGAHGHHLAEALAWTRSAAVPSGAKLSH
jgi:hypothetical protein